MERSSGWSVEAVGIERASTRRLLRLRSELVCLRPFTLDQWVSELYGAGDRRVVALKLFMLDQWVMLAFIGPDAKVDLLEVVFVGPVGTAFDDTKARENGENTYVRSLRKGIEGGICVNLQQNCS